MEGCHPLGEVVRFNSRENNQSIALPNLNAPYGQGCATLTRT
jgi:hypothetical protein